MEPIHNMEFQGKILQNSTDVEPYLLMDNARPMLAILAAYFTFIFWIGPTAMANRKPYELKSILQVYNFIQVVFAGYVLIQPLRSEAVLTTYRTPCRPQGSPMKFHPDVTYVTWLYFMAKAVDLLDTVFIVLRKKQRQITFLHVYHHASMVAATWAFNKYIEDPVFAVLQYLNTTVHLIMYTYYFISALGPKYAKYIWWKKYLTAMQLVQFLITMGYVLLVWCFDCAMSQVMGFYTLYTVALFFVLFFKFYLQNYTKSTQKLS